MIAQAEYTRRTLPATILSGLLMWVPLGVAGVVAFVILPQPQPSIILIVAVLNLSGGVFQLKQLAATTSILNYRDSRRAL